MTTKQKNSSSSRFSIHLEFTKDTGSVTQVRRLRLVHLSSPKWARLRGSDAASNLA